MRADSSDGFDVHLAGLAEFNLVDITAHWSKGYCARPILYLYKPKLFPLSCTRFNSHKMWYHHKMNKMVNWLWNCFVQWWRMVWLHFCLHHRNRISTLKKKKSMNESSLLKNKITFYTWSDLINLFFFFLSCLWYNINEFFIELHSFTKWLLVGFI